MVKFSVYLNRRVFVMSVFSILQTANEAYWTETLKDKSVAPVQVNAQASLETFRLWINNNIESLPGHDHAMLFTA